MAVVRVEWVTLGSGFPRQEQILDQIHSGVAPLTVTGETAVEGPTCPGPNLHARITVIEGNVYVSKPEATALNSILLVGAGDREVLPVAADETLSFLELA